MFESRYDGRRRVRKWPRSSSAAGRFRYAPAREPYSDEDSSGAASLTYTRGPACSLYRAGSESPPLVPRCPIATVRYVSVSVS